MTVAACFVTRNHEASLGRAIRSVAGFATEVVVADTGSTDGTTTVAADLGARVCPIAWADDFAAACNTVLGETASDWVLWMNPDEHLNPASLPALAAAVTRPEVFAARVLIQQELQADRPGFGTTGRQARLFRRNPALRHQGRLHPAFIIPIEEIARSRGQLVVDIDAAIHRDAFLTVPTPDKLRWVVHLLEAELRDRPGQLPFLIELGRSYLWLNDPRGHAVLAEASEQVRTIATSPAPPTPLVGMLLEYLLSVSPEQSLSKIGRDEARELAGRWFPRTPPVLWAVAGERFAIGDYQAAAKVLERLVNMGRTGDFDSSESFTPAIIGPAAVEKLGLCYLHLERWPEAKICFGRLAADPTYRESARRGYLQAEQEQKP